MRVVMAKKLKIWSESAKSFKISLLVHGIKGLLIDGAKLEENCGIVLQIRWKGPRNRDGCRSKSIRNSTTEQFVQRDGSVHWGESFEHVCKLKFLNSRSFSNWDIHLEIHAFSSDSQSQTPILGDVTVDIAEFVTPNTSKTKFQIPVNCNLRGSLVEAELTMALSLSEIQTKKSTVKRRVLSLFSPSDSCKDFHQIDNKTGIPIRQDRKQSKSVKADTQDGSQYDGISECKFTPEQSKKFLTTESSSSLSSSSPEGPEFGYGDIAVTNLLVEMHSKDRGNGVDLRKDLLPPTTDEVLQRPSSLFSLLQWKKSSIVTTHRHKRMSLLDKDCQESGNEPHDDRRNQPNPQPDSTEKRNTREQDSSLSSGFDEEDCIVIDSWEKMQFVSRSGSWELHTDTLLASRDQCSEKVGGEGACAVIVTVIADWLHRNHETLPLKSQFDKLIKEGSQEWRKLCQNESHLEKFADKHFDLETVIAAEVKPLSVVSTYVGFFLPHDMIEKFDFLEGLKSFDSIWDEHVSNVESGWRIYIVSWNDHFFTMKVEKLAIYLIDTLGKRLHEGCNQAYILKFDKESTIYALGSSNLDEPERGSPNGTGDSSSGSDDAGKEAEFGREVKWQGRSSCKEFIKNFLAALPLRELQDDVQKGLITKEQLLRRLQIEFHHTTSICD